jgi:uncharacterized protein (TIGR02646 family)
MLNISKYAPSRSLVNYAIPPGAVYDGPNFTPVKDKLRIALVKEQHGLCAYCMSRIEAVASKMKVEHWRCQDHFPQLQLDYGNLLGVCKGHEGAIPKDQTCDTRKGNDDLKYNPCNPLHDVFSKLKYDFKDGALHSTEADFDLQVSDEDEHGNERGKSVLNLNLPLLKRNRREAIKAVQAVLASGSIHFGKAEIERRIQKIENESIWPEYAGVIFYYLQKRLKAC